MKNENSGESIAIKLEELRYEYGGIDKMPPEVAHLYKALQEKLAAENAPARKQDAESGVIKLLLWPAAVIGLVIAAVILGLAIGVVHHHAFLDGLSKTNAGRIVAYQFIDAARGDLGSAKGLFLIIGSGAVAGGGVYDFFKARYSLIVVVGLYLVAIFN